MKMRGGTTMATMAHAGATNGLPKFHSQFAPEQLLGPNRNVSSNQHRFWGAMLNFRGVICLSDVSWQTHSQIIKNLKNERIRQLQ